MKVIKLVALAGLLLFSVSSCDLLNYDDIQEEQRMDGGGDDPPCQDGCK